MAARWRLVRDDDGAPSKLPRGRALVLSSESVLPLGRADFFSADAEEGAQTMSRQLLAVALRDAGGPRVSVKGSTPVSVAAAEAGEAPRALRKGDDVALAPGDVLLLHWCEAGKPRAVRLRVEAEAEAAPAAACAAQPRAASPPPAAKRAASPGAGAGATQPEAKRMRHETPAAAAASEPAETTTESCCICCCDVPTAQGAACTEGHFVCDGCFDEHAEGFANDELRHIEARKGQLYCPMRTGGDGGCSAPPFTIDDIKLRSAATLASFIRAQMQLAAKQSIDSERAAAAARAAAESALSVDERALLRGREAVETLFSEACPGCGQAFLDFDGCFALTCVSCKVGFCALCLKHCGDDAHGHLGKVGECPFANGPYGSPDQLNAARRKRRQWGLWQLLDDKRSAFQLPAGRALRQRLLDAVKKSVEDPAIMGVPIAHFMTEANRPRSLRELARSAVVADDDGGGQLVADPDFGDPMGIFGALGRAARNPGLMRRPAPAPPAPPQPLPGVHCAVVKRRKGEACKRCDRLLPQGAAALKLEVCAPLVIRDPISGQEIPTAAMNTTNEYYHLRCYHAAHGQPDRLYEALRGRGLAQWPGDAQAELYALFPEPQHNRAQHADAAEARAAAAAGLADADGDDDLAGGSSGEEEEDVDVSDRAGGGGAAYGDVPEGGSSGDEGDGDLLEAAPPVSSRRCGGDAPAAAHGGCTSTAPPRRDARCAPAEDDEDEVIILDD